MNIKNAVLTRIFLLLAAVASFGLYNQASAQIIDPFREYTNPDEIVTFDRSTTYNEAIAIINTFTQEYENRFIVDRSGYSGEIGVSLPPMHWKDALNYIMRFLNLEAQIYDDFYEIHRKPEPQQVTGLQQTTPATSAANPQTSGVPRPTLETREIQINATFFEGNKRALQEIGIDWSTLTSAVPANLEDIVAGQQNEGLPQVGFEDQFVSVNSFGASSVSQNAFNALVNLGEVGPGISIQALFSAFEADNLGKVLATPSIKVMDGQQGNIQVGQDFSIKQRDIAGNVTDNFVSTGTILTVTPNIITQNDTSFIYLDLQVERSTVQPDVVSTIINKQEARTSALLVDGEATYVAGLFRTEETEVRRGVPILKDLPWWFFGLRYLFGYNSNDINENELIIIVQAEMVKPLSQRYGSRRLTKREILDNTRSGMRTDLDRVFEMESHAVDIPVTEAEIIDEQETEIDEKLAEPVTVAQDTTETDTAEEIAEDVLTEEETKLAEELSIPVQNPELMVVVPKAFDLEQFLKHQENGLVMEDKDTDLRFFIIGGSFLVPANAYNFLDTLEKQGYDSRMLFNPQSRFHYIAFEGYNDFNRAVQRLRHIQRTINSEAWLFTMQSSTQTLK